MNYDLSAFLSRMLSYRVSLYFCVTRTATSSAFVLAGFGKMSLRLTLQKIIDKVKSRHVSHVSRCDDK